MILKILQLNIWNGAFINEIIEYIKKNDFDVANLQEVSGGKFSTGGSYEGSTPLHPKNIGMDTFQRIEEGTGMTGILVKNLENAADPTTYQGNATFFKKTIQSIDSRIIWMKETEKYENASSIPAESRPRSALAITLLKDNKTITLVNTHMAWGQKPIDEDYKIHQATVLRDYIKTIQNPYILTGDFNMTPDTEVVKMFSQIANNVGAIYDIKNTINSRIHVVKELFPPGLCVDYIFVDPLFHIKKFNVIDDVDLSDHLGLSAEVEI